MLLKVTFGIFIFFCEACFSEKKDGDFDTSGISYSDSVQSFFKSFGVVTFIPSDNNIQKSIEILNQDGTLYAKISVGSNKVLIDGSNYTLIDFSKDRGLLSKHNFYPKEFYPDKGVIQFEYLNVKNNLIEIFINKESGLKKYIKPDGLFKVETWRVHFLGCIIDFDKQKNLIRYDHNQTSKSIGYENADVDYIFIISEIANDWIKIECGEVCDYSCEDGKKFDGWIRWKEKDKLLIRLLYSC